MEEELGAWARSGRKDVQLSGLTASESHAPVGRVSSPMFLAALLSPATTAQPSLVFSNLPITNFVSRYLHLPRQSR